MKKTRLLSLLFVLALTCGILLATVPLQAGAATEGDYTYSVSGGEATITGYTGTNEGISIPSTLGGYPVTAIGDGAFYGASFRHLTIPNSVTTIGGGAFGYCMNLQMIEIPSSVTSLGSGAFEDCIGASTIAVLGNLTTLNGAFDGCINVRTLDLRYTSIKSIDAGSASHNLADIYLPASLTELSADWFKESRKLWNVSIAEGNSNYFVKDDCVISSDGTLVIATTNAKGIPEGVTAIGSYAFSNRAGFTEVTIPENVTKLDANAFAGCYRLTDIYCEAASKPDGWDDNWLGDCNATVHWPEDNSDFTYEISNGEVTITGYNGPGGDVVIPETIEGCPVAVIGQGAFSWCSSLLSITIPDGVKSIELNAFRECRSLASIVIPESVTTIEQYAFAYCDSITTVDIPDSVTVIEEGTFGCCVSLKNVTLPGCLSELKKGAFYQCSALEEIVVPDGTKIIGEHVFDGCVRLSSVKLPDSVTSIKPYAFAYCESLTSVDIPDGTKIIGEHAFDGCVRLLSVKLPDGVTNIEPYTFAYCESLTSVDIPSGVTVIGEGAFGCCTLLNRVTLPRNLGEINMGAFYQCVTLESILLPRRVYQIGAGVFSGCVSLTDIYCERTASTPDWSPNWNLGTTASVHWGYKPTDSNLVFSGASITLFDDLTVNFKADAALFETYTDPYVIFIQNGIETTVTEYVVEDGQYVFAFADILPNQMNDEITATMYATVDGTVYKSEGKTYSVATYCYNMLAKHSDDEKLRTLLVDILGYGAAAQIYTNHNTAKLANANLTAEQKAWASADREFETVENASYKTIENPMVTWIGAGLDLSESIAVRFEFNAASTDGLTAQITCGGKTWETALSGKEVLPVSINAGYMSEPIYVTIYDGETAVSDTVCYSIESYAFTYGEDTELGDLVKAMMKYGDAAKAYITE